MFWKHTAPRVARRHQSYITFPTRADLAGILTEKGIFTGPTLSLLLALGEAAVWALGATFLEDETV
jgi:hypothetical protein